MGVLFYSQALQTVVPVSSTHVAEMVKLLENTFRMINIGLVNEMALMCDRMGINVWEVIEAAATKPFGFMPFYPARAWVATAFPSTRSISRGRPSRRASRRASSNWPATSTARCRISWSTRCRTRSTMHGKAVKGSRVHVVGVAYKRNIDDMRESPALDVILLLKRRGAIVTYSDPYVPDA